ncbi:peptide-binding protein [Duganella sp. BJB488]|uniref:peptide-binding protein n=1 Tax=unclassified Duganella TaxID=2636909 RepID=UPI000E356DBE|nr:MULTISPECIES: peptide-binding protein [unclassified Duganella]RFP17846.1 peptide-binding protein [Duganella sp. BJB489]RFP22353.1 peptide-binding protein [Duganella sp. BJB488]RFP37686.1 peptide-binding protein [Duganella sp. BJB480]
MKLAAILLALAGTVPASAATATPAGTASATASPRAAVAATASGRHGVAAPAAVGDNAALAVKAGATVTVGNGRALEAALRRARADRRIRRIVLAAGTYELAAPLLIDERLSGTTGAPFELSAAPRAQVVLSGAIHLPTLRWEPWRDGIWRARHAGPPFQRLWLGKQALVRARYPNADPTQSGFGGAADATGPERVARWHDPAGAVLHALHGNRWGGLQVPILGKNADGSLAYGAQVGNNRIMPPSATDRYVENVFEELDAPGEWFDDRRDGWLYFKPLDGARPPARGFRAGMHEALVRIEGHGAQVNHVRIRKLGFQDTEPTFLKADEPLLRSDWKFYRAGAVTIENAADVRIEDGDFTGLGGHAIVVSGRARQVRVSGNHIHAIGGTAVAFVGRPEAARSPLYEYHEHLDQAALDPAPGPRSDAYPRDSAAVDNLIHDVGQIDRQAAGVQIAMSARITVDHNSIHHVPRAGINIGDGNWGGHRITNNDVFDTVRESGDHGAFNSWGRDRYWDPDRKEMDRRVASDPRLPLLDAVEPIIMRRNRFRCDHGWDVDLDDGASNYVIEQNLLLAGGLKLREGFARVVRNNIMVNGTFHPHVWFADSGDVFEANVVMAPYQPIDIAHWGRSVDRNLFASADGLAEAQARGTDAGSVAGDPRFAAPAEGDYTVTNAALAARIGFVNFPMHDFGVRPARLKALAAAPAYPQPNAAATAAAPPHSAQTLEGLLLKPVETLGEQSAAGLGAATGLRVLAVRAGSRGEAAGLRARDAIIGAGRAGQGGIAPVAEFVSLQALLAAGGDLELLVVRDQARIVVRWQQPAAATGGARP